MRDLHQSPSIHVDRMVGIYAGERTYHYEGLDVLPVAEFLKELHKGNIF